MIQTAVSHGYGEENRHSKQISPESIQLALFKYEMYDQYKKLIEKEVTENAIDVKVVHLPIDSLRYDFKKSFYLIEELTEKYGCHDYVMHPNKSVERYIIDFINAKIDANLCLENFQWKKNKVLRSPLEIIEWCQRNENIFMTFDTSHADEVWFDHMVLPYILKYTKVIHLSNRSKTFGQHMPFNSPKGDLNLVKFVKDIKRRHWSGTIVLEYMEEYQSVIMKNYHYLNTLVK